MAKNVLLMSVLTLGLFLSLTPGVAWGWGWGAGGGGGGRSSSIGSPSMPVGPGGSPSTPGGGMGRGRASGAAPRLTHFKWDVVEIGPMRAVTGEEGEEEMTPEKHVRQVLGFDKAARYGDKRPVLVYFHWPHEDGKEGKISEKTCAILDNEEAARWSLLYRCVQIDMGTSTEEFTELLGAKDKPSFALMDKDAKTVFEFPAYKSARKVTQALEKGLKKFPEYQKKVKADLKQQTKWMAEAKKLKKAKKEKEALALIDKVRFSNLRVGDEFDKAQDAGRTLSAKLSRN